MKKVSVIFLYLLLHINATAQHNFSVIVQPDTIQGLPGLQSFVAAQHNHKWIMIGGRTDGLHQRQPTTSFLSTSNNTNIYVVDPLTKTVWSASVNALPAYLKEQLQSTNMNFCYSGNKLYIAGGYGYSATLGNHKTYASLIVVDMPGLINAVINNTSIMPHFRQISDPMFAITGGQMAKLGDMFLLVGGHKFDGRYNPNNGPSFIQEYSNQIRKFRLNDDGVNLSISYQNTITDINQLHRRDYNLAPQVFPDGRLGYTAFSGVFQIGANLPFLNSVDIDTVNYVPGTGFNQLLNHYHSGKLSVYDSLANAMSTVFFGGMAQYYYDAGGNLIQDNEVPFVSTIAKVTRAANNSMSEIKTGNLPGFIGSGAEVFLNHTLPLYENEVIRLNHISQDTVLAGYLVGGIQSSAANIFFINTGTQSIASGSVYKILLVRSQPLPVQMIYFRGKRQAGFVLLEWKTGSERNNRHFDIERSADGVQFSSLTVMDGSGNSNHESSYSFRDEAPLSDLNYYRIKQVDNDGGFTYSSIIVVRFEHADNGIVIYPNPVYEKIIIELDKVAAGNIQIKIFDMNGRVLVRRSISVLSRQIHLDVRGIKTGEYLIEVKAEQKKYTRKFVKL